MGIIFFLREISIVGTLPIYTALAPQARTVSLAVIGLTASLGLSMGAFVAPLLSTYGGFHAISFASAFFSLVGVFVLWVRIKERIEGEQ